MFRETIRWGCVLKLEMAISCAMVCSTNYAVAQVTPDGTLPNNSSVIQDGNTSIITGGTRFGGNLFHSFQEFSVPTGGTAFFNNAVDIQNIISRITGKSVSNIDGLIRANSIANLFLINPSGIIFGRNARLSVGGSFFASTANNLKFADGKEFSAIAPQTTPLLTVSVPIGLQFGQNPGSILNQSKVTNSSDEIVGLQVPPGKTLALVGGDVTLAGGGITADGGRIELGSLTGTQEVGLDSSDNSWVLKHNSESGYGNIRLEGGAIINTSGEGGGSIQIRGSRLNVTEGSFILADTLGTQAGGDILLQTNDAIVLSEGALVSASTYSNGQGGNLKIDTSRLTIRDGGLVQSGTSGVGQGGTLTVNTSDFVEVIGTTTTEGLLLSGLTTNTLGNGAAGDLTITTGRLVVRNGGSVQASTDSSGRGGNITVRALDSVEVIGTTPPVRFFTGADEDDGLSPSGLFTQSQGSGAAGNLNIATEQLIVTDGGQISASAFFSNFKGGNLTVSASNSIKVIGTSGDGQFATGLFTDTQGDQPAGNLTIDTGKLIVTDGGQISASTFFGKGEGGILTVNAKESVELTGTSADSAFLSSLLTQSQGAGRAGDLKITTKQLIIRDGALVSSSTRRIGAGGNLTVNASSIELKGTTPNRQYNSGLFTQTEGIGDAGSLTIVAGKLTVSEQALVSAGTFGKGQGGDLTITTGQLVVRDSSAVTVSSRGTGTAGNLNITARSIRLDNRGGLTATSQSGNGGNITIKGRNLLLMRRGSNISTTAGIAGAGGNGGNITIDASNGFIVANKNENSDIVANAFEGSGGQVNITATRIFGLAPISREELSRRLGTTDAAKLKPSQLYTSDVSAISQTDPSLNGQVIINTPDVDPSRGLVQLPTEPVNVEVVQGCQAGGQQSSSVAFFNTGKGGLAVNPYEPLSSSNIWEDLPAPDRVTNRETRGQEGNLTNLPDKIVEAQGWVTNKKGEVTLVAEILGTDSQNLCRFR